MNKIIKIVVSRFNENIEWTEQFKNVIVYNKGDKLPESFNEILLSNVGREGHTYYKYIYDNYDNLEDYTIFLQGNPFDHSPNIIKNINNLLDIKDLNLDFRFLSEQIMTCNFLNGHGPMKEVYCKLYGNCSNNINFIFGAGAQFIVSKKNILRNSRDFYLKIIKLLDYSIHPNEGFVIERLHKYIFTGL